jgi:recombination protein RecR
MKSWAPSLEDLIEELTRLPGIGRKTAQRIAFHLLRRPSAESHRLAEAINRAKESIRTCSLCYGFTEQDPCPICADADRDPSVICVVEEPSDVLALERAGSYQGLYHVLGGRLSPLDGVTPDSLRMKELTDRVKDGSTTEVIVATNPNAEGEATALYIAKLLKPLGVRLTRIARGLPVGSDLDFADEVTLSRALEGRREY